MVFRMPTTIVSRANRRSAVRLMSAAGIGGLLAPHLETGASKRIEHISDVLLAIADPLYYTDALGRELAKIRVFSLNDVSLQAGIRTPPGQRDLMVSLKIWNSSRDALSIPPEAFALWGEDGFLFRPQDLLIDAVARCRERFASIEPVGTAVNATAGAGLAATHVATDVRETADEYTLAKAWLARRLSADPMLAGRDRSGDIIFRVPERTMLAGLLFTLEPERMFVVVDFARAASVIVD